VLAGEGRAQVPARRPKPITVTTRFEEDEAGELRHVPFDLPTRVQAFRLTVSYNDQIDSSPTLGGGNTLDIGLFDPQGIEAGGPGFRGWSGSNKLDIVVGSKWATPPYRAGKPQAGTWHLLLGAYKVGPNGLDVNATIELNPELESPPAPAPIVLADLHRRELPPPAEDGWFRGDLHAHTIYSDGSASPEQLAAAAYEAGLDFYGITDHNRAQSPVGLAPEGKDWPILVPGVEVTTYAGHFNVWGTDTWYDFRDPSREGLQAAVDAALADGGLVAMNHPKPFGPDWNHREVTGFDCIEPWNGWWGRINEASLAVWDEALRRGERVTGVCGSDVHHPAAPNSPDNPLTPARIGWPTLWVRVDGRLTVKRILDAVRSGQCFMSESPSGPQLYLTRDGERVSVRVVGGGGSVLTLVAASGLVSSELIAGEDETWTYALSVLGARLRYVRAQLHAQHGGIRALTNPVWLDNG
jgi:hypothetical protein